MAEATSEEQLNDRKFYCHQCSTQIRPKLPDFLCPTCDGGFIEEVNDVVPSDVQQRMGFPIMFGSGNPFAAGSLDTGSINSDDEDEYRDGAAAPFPQARISVRTVGANGAEGGEAFQGLLEHLLSSLTGGGGAGGGGRHVMFGGPPGQFNFLNLGMMGGGLAGNPGDYAWGPGGLDSIITQLMNQLEGTGPPPAPIEKIDSLPVVAVSSEHIEKNAQCSVCFDEFKLDEKANQLPCQHMYHPDCIKPWLELHGTCPVCRKTLDGEDTSCDQNTQSIPETLQTLGLDTSSLSSPTSINPQAQQQRDSNGSSAGAAGSSGTTHPTSNTNEARSFTDNDKLD